MFTSTCSFRSGAWLVALVVAGIVFLLAAEPAAGETLTQVQNNTQRNYSVDLPVQNFVVGTSAKVEAWAGALCGHGFAFEEPSDVGYYIRITRSNPAPPVAEANELSVHAEAQVEHAGAIARQSLTPYISIVGNTAQIQITTSSAANAWREPCNEGFSHAIAGFKARVDPIVFGSASYIGFDGLSYDPFPARFDGVYRYVEHDLELLDGTGFRNAMPGLAPVMTNGYQPTNRLGLSQIVRSGSDDDPDNESGTTMYQLEVGIAADGDFVVTWTPGSDTADFAFTFDQTPVQIEQAVHAYLNGAGGDLPVVTARVTLLQSEATMPNVTLLGIDEADAWHWGSGSPKVVDWPVKCWRGPDVAGAGRLSSAHPLVQPPVLLADDFTLPSADPVYALRWYGSYLGEFWPLHQPNLPYSIPFVVSFHPDVGGVPGPFVYQSAVQADRFFVHWLPSNEAFFEHNARLCPPFIPIPGQAYFVSIADTTTMNWAWLDAACAWGNAPASGGSLVGPWSPGVMPDASFVLLGAGAEVDQDCDADVDGADYTWQADCMAGPNMMPAPAGGMTPQQCLATYDTDQDGDVDLRDHQAFALLFTGPF